jgi:5-methylcytosine-specific restriction endonuclease McrA
MPELAGVLTLRRPCASCGHAEGFIRPTNGQQCVFCSWCQAFQYNAPKTETGLRARSVTTVHAAIKPKLRAKVIERATGRCEFCGARGILHVDHLLSVNDGLSFGLEDAEINSLDNLAALCEECNLGKGSLSITPRFYVALLKARMRSNGL